jgi:hypothetical protein
VSLIYAPFSTFLNLDPPGAVSLIYTPFSNFSESGSVRSRVSFFSFHSSSCLSIYAAPFKDLVYFLIKMLISCVTKTDTRLSETLQFFGIFTKIFTTI